VWRLPAWFKPDGKKRALSYHWKRSHWAGDGNFVLLRTVGRGQEFVLDCDDYPEALGWLSALMEVADVASPD
jgi:hypothetical protein